MQVARMKAESRNALGRNQLRALRAKGWTPAVVYGEKKEALSISISEWELEQHIKKHHKVFRLEIDGKSQDAMLQDIQFDVLTDHPIHCDFIRVDLTKPIEVEVEVGFSGYPVGAGKGGTLVKDHAHIMVRCVPTAIPEGLVVAVDKLDLDMSIHARDVVLPAGVELVSNPELVVCHVAKLTGPAVEAAPAADEAAAPAADAKKADAKKPEEKKPDAKKK